MNIIIELSKYILIFLMVSYAYLCFGVFAFRSVEGKKSVLLRQNIIMFLMHGMAYMVLYMETQDRKVVGFYLAQVVLVGATILLYTQIYPRVSRLVVNNLCMLLCIGFIMLTRLNYEKAIKQFVFASAGMILSLILPIVIRKLKMLSKWRVFYGGLGIVSLGAVVILGRVSYGAKLGFSIAGINIQPSELVKIVFVFFVAASFHASISFRNILLTTGVAALHVLILVASTDLGAALIIFIVYLVMLYVATRNPLYLLAGLGSGSIAAVGAHHLFRHVKVRVSVWKNPLAVYNQGGYQVAQSLFAIGTGGWFGTGLYQGNPDMIPVADTDFIFSAISEEMGLIFALALILICISCYVMFLNIAMQLHNVFYKLVALGLGTCYIFQVFLTVGGVTKFIPSTGVTLPLVSYGGSSLVSTLFMFAIIQGLYILREDEEESIEKQRREQLRAERSNEEVEKKIGKEIHEQRAKKEGKSRR